MDRLRMVGGFRKLTKVGISSFPTRGQRRWEDKFRIELGWLMIMILLIRMTWRFENLQKM